EIAVSDHMDSSQSLRVTQNQENAMMERPKRMERFERLHRAPPGANLHETEVRRRETANVGQNNGQVGRADAEPGRERSVVFVDARRGNPAASTGVVVGIDG